MAYCTNADVAAQNSARTPYSVSTTPTSTAVDDFIDQIAGEIDTRLAAKGVSTPVAAPATFVAWLLNLNALGAAALAEMAAYPEADGGQGSTPQGERLWKMYQQGLAAISKGDAIPPEAVTTSERLLARSWQTENPEDDGSYEQPQVRARQERGQW